MKNVRLFVLGDMTVPRKSNTTSSRLQRIFVGKNERILSEYYLSYANIAAIITANAAVTRKTLLLNQTLIISYNNLCIIKKK